MSQVLKEKLETTVLRGHWGLWVMRARGVREETQGISVPRDLPARQGLLEIEVSLVLMVSRVKRGLRASEVCPVLLELRD